MRKAKLSPYYSEPLLFESDNVQWNTALGLLKDLRLAEARTAFQAYRDVNQGCLDTGGYLSILDLIENGFADLPEGKAGALALGRLARNLRELIQRLGMEAEPVPSVLPRLLFERAAACLNLKELSSDPFLSDGTPAGLLYLQAGQADPAITALQAALPHLKENASIYGYLGDAYTLRGDSTAARICYLEAFLIDPTAIDMETFADPDLLALERRLVQDDALSPEAARLWLPSHAYIDGLFRPKIISLLEAVKTLVEEYLNLEKEFLRTGDPRQGAALFLRALVLCDNETFLRMVKGIDSTDIRARMKSLNPVLFDVYLQSIQDRTRPRSEQRRK